MLAVLDSSGHPDAAVVAEELILHGDSINERDFDTAWASFTPRMRDRLGGSERWQAGLQTSSWLRLEVLDVQRNGGSATLDTALMTRQDPEFGPSGQECSQWALTYGMILHEGRWLIDSVKAGAEPAAC